MSTTRHFADELMKLAFLGGNVPKIPTSRFSHTTQTGSGVPMHAQPPLASFKPPKPVGVKTQKAPSMPAANRTANPVQKIKTVPSIPSTKGERPSSGASASGPVG